MKAGRDADLFYLVRIVEIIDLISDSLSRSTFETFVADRDRTELTAYRLAVIGEFARKLSGETKARTPEIGWESIYRMRNIIVHHYERVDPGKVWAVVTDDLETLAAACRREISSLEP